MLEELFISKVRVEILALFLREQDKPLHVREVTRRVGTEINAVRRELARLTRIGLLKRQPRGNRVYFTVRPEFPFYHELMAMIAKDRGLGGLILKRLKDLGKVDYAFMTKRFLRGEPPGEDEVDLLVVGKVNLGSLDKLVKSVEKKLGREVHYTVMASDELEFRKQRRDPFIYKLLMTPHVVLAGDEERFSKL